MERLATYGLQNTVHFGWLAALTTDVETKSQAACLSRRRLTTNDQPLEPVFLIGGCK